MNYLQNAIFTIVRKHNLQTGKFFKTLYRVLIGSDSGPRLGPYILAMGRENVAAALAGAARMASKQDGEARNSISPDSSR